MQNKLYYLKLFSYAKLEKLLTTGLLQSDNNYMKNQLSNYLKDMIRQYNYEELVSNNYKTPL